MPPPLPPPPGTAGRSPAPRPPVPPDRPSRRRALGLGVLLGGGLLLRALAILHAETGSMESIPLMDDSFYYFTLGRSVAAGAGPRIDPAFVTNAFQPLWGAWVSLLFVVLPEGAAVYGAMATGALLGLVTGVLAWALVRHLTGSARWGMVGGALWLLNPAAVRRDVNGMETALATAALMGAFLVLVRLAERPSWKRALVAGAVLGVAVQARVDALVLAVAASAALALSERGGGRARRDLPGGDGPASRPGLLVRMAVLWAGVVVVALPWIAFSLGIGKPVMPESGRAVRVISLALKGLPDLGFVRSLLEAPALFLGTYAELAVLFTATWARQSPLLLPLALPLYALDDLGLGPAVMAPVGVVAAGAVAWRLIRPGSLPVPAATGRRFLGWCFVLWLVGMTAGYAGLTVSDWFFFRYATPPALVFSLLLVAVAAPAVERLVSRGGAARVAAVGYGGLVAASLVALLVAGPQRWMVDPPFDDGPTAEERVVAWIEANTPPDAAIGAFQTGYFGWALDRRLVNLDGKVNPPAREALRTRTSWEHVCALELGWLVDIPALVESLLPAERDDPRLERVVHERGRIVDFAVYRVERDLCPRSSAASSTSR